MIKHINMKVSGKVQGVFFRASTKEKADVLGVKGFVRNERDGSVYIEAEADEQTLEQFKTWCLQGPQMSRVEKLDIMDGDVVNFRTFEVTR